MGNHLNWAVWLERPLAWWFVRGEEAAFPPEAQQLQGESWVNLTWPLKEGDECHVELLLICVGQCSLKQLHHSFLRRVSILHLQVEASLPNIELLSLFPAQLSLLQISTWTRQTASAWCKKGWLLGRNVALPFPFKWLRQGKCKQHNLLRKECNWQVDLQYKGPLTESSSIFGGSWQRDKQRRSLCAEWTITHHLYSEWQYHQIWEREVGLTCSWCAAVPVLLPLWLCQPRQGWSGMPYTWSTNSCCWEIPWAPSQSQLHCSVLCLLA